MGTINNGTQTIIWDYKQELVASQINKWFYTILKAGVYDGGTLSIDSGNNILIAPLHVIVETSTNLAIHINTADNATLTISELTPYVTCQFTWADSETNYMDFTAKAVGDILTTDIVLGMGVYVMGALTSFDYTSKTWGFHNRAGDLHATDIYAETITTTDDIIVKSRDVYSSLYEPGDIKESARLTPSAGWLLCDGATVSRTTYSDLFDAITANKGIVTITSANPGVVTLSGHGFSTGSCIELTTTGTLPTNLSPNTNYYVIYVGVDSFRLATSAANAIAGTAIDTSGGSPSGTHTLRHCPYGISGASNFLLPNRAAVVGVGAGSQTINTRAKTAVLGLVEEDQMQLIEGALGNTGEGGVVFSGTCSGAFVLGTNTDNSVYTSGDSGYRYLINFDSSKSTGARTGTTTRENRIGMNYYIKY
jgi:hypothetical protein